MISPINPAFLPALTLQVPERGTGKKPLYSLRPGSRCRVAT
jgi:hypothetical protein